MRSLSLGGGVADPVREEAAHQLDLGVRCFVACCAAVVASCALQMSPLYASVLDGTGQKIMAALALQVSSH